MLNNLFKKNVLVDDRDNTLAFEIMYATSTNIKDFKDLCAHNPKKCRKRREEICKKVIELLGYKSFKEFDNCKIYQELYKVKSRSRRGSSGSNLGVLKPTAEFIRDIDSYGSVELRKFIIKNGYLVSERLPDSRTLERLEIFGSIADRPTIIDVRPLN
jgi:hypothetical protein